MKSHPRRRGVRVGAFEIPIGPIVILVTVVVALWGVRSWGQSVSQTQSPAVTRAAAPSPATDALPIDVDRGAAGLSRDLRALLTWASILQITAHPDDEDGGMLAYETRREGARGILMTLNRGEGGQNAMSNDFYDALGQVRTQELLAADRYYGVDQYWSRVVDYGFSKTREEALDKWGHDRVLSDVVRVIRMTRPLVITSVFVGAATDGHGHHQVAGQMAQEAYLAAGDPTKFAEQIREGLRPWSPLKVYARVPLFQATKEGMYDYAIDKFVPVRFFDYIHKTWSDKTPSTTLEIPEGEYSSAAGLTFLQIARTGWGLQKSQNGGGTTPPPVPLNSAYHRYDSRVTSSGAASSGASLAEKETGFYEGVDTSLPGIASLAKNDPQFSKEQFLPDGLAQITKLADQARSQYSAARPSAIAPILAEGLKSTRALSDQVRKSSLTEPAKGDVLFELGIKEQQFQKALADSLGVHLEVAVTPEKAPEGPLGFPTGPVPTFTIAIPGQSFNVETKLFNPSPETLAVERVGLSPSDGKAWKIRMSESASAAASGAQPVVAGKLGEWKFAVTAPADAAFTRPYFSRPDEEQAYYDIQDPRYVTLSTAPYPLSARAEIGYHGVTFEIGEVVQAYERIPGIGVVANPLLVEPAISVTVSPSAGAVPLSSKEFDFTATVHSNVKGPAQGVLRLRLPQGWRSTPAEAPFSLARDGEDQAVTFSVTPEQVKASDYTITATAVYQGRSYQEGYRLAGYDGLRRYPLFKPATYKAVGVDVKTAPGLNIGFVPGTGDDVPRALENLGLKARLLSEIDLTKGDLSGYDAIILGVRAYAVRADLKAANARLLDYVKNGGVMIVQYNLQDFDRNYGPYPYVMGTNPEKVVDEASPVTLLDPSNPALRWPNPITAQDFKGWVEERGHGFLKSWDPKYQPLVETHDPEQDPQRGGLLLAHYGKGYYVYDALALYRQLPSGVPGSYRLLANLVSLGKNPLLK